MLCTKNVPCLKISDKVTGQSVNFGMFWLNSMNLAPSLLLNSVLESLCVFAFVNSFFQCANSCLGLDGIEKHEICILATFSVCMIVVHTCTHGNQERD